MLGHSDKLSFWITENVNVLIVLTSLFCVDTATDFWQRNLATGAYYQINRQSVLTWQQAATSCKQQGGALLSVTDPNEQAIVSGRAASCGRLLAVKQKYETVCPEMTKDCLNHKNVSLSILIWPCLTNYCMFSCTYTCACLLQYL